MRCADDQLKLIRDRAERLRRRRQLLLREGAGALCLLPAVLLCFLLPRAEGVPVPAEGSFFGSLILTSPLAGVIVVGVLAFALGVCVTLLCIHRREQRGETEDEDS